MRRATAVVTTALTAVLLTACTGGDDAPDDTAGPTSSDATTSPVPDASAPVTGDEPVAGGATEECLQGTWRLDLAAMQDDLRRMLVDAGDDQGSVEVVVDGTSSYEFAAGGEFRAAVDSTSAMAISADGTELSSSSRSVGDLTARWSLAGDQLTVSDVDSSGLEVTTTGTIDGEDLDVPDGSAEDAIEALPPTVSTATCSAGTLTLVSAIQEDESSEPVSITWTLRR